MNAIAIQNESFYEITLKAAVICDDFDFATRAAALLERRAMLRAPAELCRHPI